MILISCAKEEPSSSPEPITQTESFYPLQVGNNWTYNYFKNIIEARSALVNTGIVVQVIITSEVETGSNTYFEIQTTTTGNDNICGFCEQNGVESTQVRDSLGYLIDGKGTILFSSVNRDAYLVSNNEWGDVYRILKDAPELVEVPAGQFTALNNERYTLNPNGVPYLGRDHLYFANGIGEVKRTIIGTVTNTLLFEKHLIAVNLIEN